MEEYTREVMELKNLVTRILEKKGVLAKIRAQLRGSVFETIEEEDRALENEDGVMPALIGSCNARAKQLHASSSGKLMIALICEYMDWAQLGHTLKVYLPECNMPMDFWKHELREKFGAKSAYNEDTRPLLMEVLETYFSMEDSPGNSLKENARSTSSATESVSTSSQDDPVSIVERHSRWSLQSLSGSLPPLGRKGGLSMIDQSSVGSLHDFSHTNTAADHMADTNSPVSLDMIANLKASSPTSAGTLKENGDLETLINEDHDWRYDDGGHSEDVLQAPNALKNIQLDKRTHNSTNSWRNIEEEFIEEEIQSERENS